MIDKLTPKFLDKSSDYKLVRKTSLIDALNIYIDTETGEDNSGGVIKPIKGTQAIGVNSNDVALKNKDYKAVGSTTDENTGIVYFFVWCEEIGEHGIWAYDARGVLPSYNSATSQYEAPVPGKIRRIINAPEFNFPPDGFVKGDVVYSNTREFDNHSLSGIDSYPQKDAILYFTDNRNEPRKINVYRALLRGFEIDTVDNEANRQIRRDFISACPRVPLETISFSFEADPSRDVNNFATAPGFQFAYQNIYKDGLESAISPYSGIAFPPSIVERGAAKTDNILAHNKCVITIPPQNQEVESVKLLARYGNGINFIEIDEIKNEIPDTELVFDFYNDRVAGGVSPQTTDKTFDNVPQRAQAQVVASNRLAYGNYVEGYENVDCTGVQLDPIYLKRPVEILDYSLAIEPSIELCAGGSEETPNKTIGFTYNTDQFPDTIGADTQVKISFSMSPDKNFHVYTTAGGQGKSYHQSRQVGSYSKNVPGYRPDRVVNGSPAFNQEAQAYGEPAYLSDVHAGGRFLHNEFENLFGFNNGVGGTGTDRNRWFKHHSSGPGGGSDVEKDISYGTSAGNPLIIKGGKLDFSVSFMVNTAIETGGKELISKVFEFLMEGRNGDYVNGELGADAVTVIDVKRTHNHEFDLGLQDYDPIAVGSDLSNLLCAAVDGNGTSNRDGKPPSCAFIVNKANVEFYLEKSDRPSANKAFRVCIASVNINEDDDVMTCVRDMDPRSPWWAIRGSTVASPEFYSQHQSIWSTYLQVTNRVFKARPVYGEGFNANFGAEFPVTPEGAYIDGYGGRPIMEYCFGQFLVGVDDLGNKSLLDKGVNTDGVVENQFSFSLMDGEGGPGGSGAGSGGVGSTAYDALGCDKYGSIAGQIFVGADEDNVLKRSLGSQQRYLASDTSITNGIGTIGNFFALQYVLGGEIQQQLGLQPQTIGANIFGYNHTTVAMGPFYTGKIVMNNIAFDQDIANVNPGPLPLADKGDAFTTTLPLIFHSSWTPFDTTSGNSNQSPVIEAANGLYNFGVFQSSAYGSHQVSYPYPITLGVEAGGGFIDGELVSGSLDPEPLDNGYFSVDFERLHSHMELNSSVTSIDSDSSGGGLSFKSNATHELGMVYYDERGRHGAVNAIGSVYVEGLGERSGQEDKGRALIQASNIAHTPPSWAKKFKFVYSKNTSLDKFIQYSSGGAFVANSDYEGADPSTIYVSLNYLQGHPISYSDSFGARGRDGTPVMYSFTPGDRLRVLSYMLSLEGDEINRVYPVGAEFEVTGLVSFDANNTPFSVDNDGTSVTTEAMTGLFVALKNNNDAIGFRYQSVDQGEDNWGNNCIFEIFSTKKELDADDRLYYEIGETYDVVYAATPATGLPGTPGDLNYFHENKTIILKDGDVFFRRHAVNLREYSGSEGFVDMLDLDLNDQGVIEGSASPESNFKSYYLESEAATDLFPSRAISIGRPNAVDLEARRSFNESSVVHSDKDIVKARKVGYSSFNRTIPSDMEIDIKAGPLNYMTNHQDAIFFVQKNKCGHIPVDRNLISDTSGTSSLIASSKFLGTPRYYAGQAGCDGNPESVVDVDNTAYFAHKSLGKVFKVNGANGVNVISDKNVSAFLKNSFDAAIKNSGNSVRVLGGYDPLKKEYLLTVADNETLSAGSLSPLQDTTWTVGVETISTSGGIEFVYEDSGESGFEEPGGGIILFPRIKVDWSIPTNLSNASWNLVYQDGQGAGAGNLVSEASSWKASEDGPEIPLSTDIELVFTFENAGSFENEVILYAEFIGGGSFSPEVMNTAWDFSELDDSEISLTRQILGSDGYGILGDGEVAWNMDPALYGTDEHVVPNGVTVPNYQHGLSVYVNPADYAPNATVERRIPIRFLCLDEDFVIQNNFNIGNINAVTGVFYSNVRIRGGSELFTVGTGSDQVNQYIAGLSGTVFFQENLSYDDFELAIDNGNDEQPELLSFNPSHPVYGLCTYIEGGLVTEEAVGQWAQDSIELDLTDAGIIIIPGSPAAAWLDSIGLVVDSDEYDVALVLNSLTDALYGLVGQTISCFIEPGDITSGFG